MVLPEKIAAAVAAGTLTPNEARELLGLEPVTRPVLPAEQKAPAAEQKAPAAEQKAPAAEQGTTVAGRKPHPWASVPGAAEPGPIWLGWK